MASPFITEPQSLMFAPENSTIEFDWEIDNCGWEVRILTENYTLYPNIDCTRVPIKCNTDYNVSITPNLKLCKTNAMNTSVSLSITFSKNVLEYIDYIICKVFRNNEIWYKSRVNITSGAPPSTETKMRAETTMTSMSTTIKLTDSLSSVEATTSSGYRFPVHFSGAFLSMITFFFAFLSHQ